MMFKDVEDLRRCFGLEDNPEYVYVGADLQDEVGFVLNRQSLALGCQMKYELGLSYGKIQSFFESFFHFLISRSTFSRAVVRAPSCGCLRIRI